MTYLSKKTLTALIVILIIIGAFGVYTNRHSKESSTVRIGALIPLSGPGATLGEWMQKGVRAAENEINAAGGINGKKLEVVIEDDKCTGPGGISAYRKLYDANKINHFVGPLCAAARIPVLKASEADNALLITTGLAVTYGQNTTAKTFNVLPSVSIITAKIIDYGFGTLGSKNISLLSLDDEMGKESQTAFKAEMVKHGFIDPHIEIFNKGTSDMRTQISKIIRDTNDTVLVVGFTADYAVFMKQADELGLKKKIIALSPIQAPDTANANKGTSLKIYYPHPSETSSVSAQAFLDAYKKIDPTASAMSPVYLGSGYDAVKVMALATKACGDDIACANKTLSDMVNYQGANGAITFGAKGNINSAGSIEVRVLQNGTFSKVE